MQKKINNTDELSEAEDKDFPARLHHTDYAKSAKKAERPISEVYSTIDNDLARDNLENDIPDADLQDL